MLTRVPFFAGARRESVEIEPLGSLTNMSYKVVSGGIAYVLRLPGQDTWEYINRAAEEHNSGIAAAAGIGADVLYCDAGRGTMVSRFIEGESMNGAWLGRDADALVRVARTLKRLHGSGADFRSHFNAFEMIERCRDLLLGLRQPLPAGYGEVERGVEAARRVLGASPIPLAPCHNDSWPNNFIDVGGRIYLIDWEFSGMNDPLWDLGHLSTEAGFGREQDRTMVEAYFNGGSPKGIYSRLELYKALDDLLWSLWGFVQYANDNPADDFLSYAQERFELCRERISEPGFGRHLNVVRTGARKPLVESEPVR
ncbi:MAG: choline kinase family protein [Rubrobacteraceae bacterium]